MYGNWKFPITACIFFFLRLLRPLQSLGTFQLVCDLPIDIKHINIHIYFNINYS